LSSFLKLLILGFALRLSNSLTVQRIGETKRRACHCCGEAFQQLNIPS